MLLIQLSTAGEGSEADDGSSIGDAAFSATGRTASSGIATMSESLKVLGRLKRIDINLCLTGSA